MLKLNFLPYFCKVRKKRFELLRKVYVDYTITQQELEWLAGRVQFLQVLIEKLCKEKIANFALS